MPTLRLADSSVGPPRIDQRFYASSYGRFLTPDWKTGKFSSPGSLNRYAYVLGDPVNRNDRRGTDSCVVSNGWDGGGNWAFILDCQYDDYWDYSPTELESAMACITDPICMQANMPTEGGGPSTQGAGAGFVTITNFTTAGAQAQAVQNSLRWIEAQISSFPLCGNWLGGNDNVTNTINMLLGQSSTVTTDSVGVGNFSSSGANTIANAVFGTSGTNLPTDGSALLAVNLNGAYFNSQAPVGYGVTGINAGSSQARLFILLHELAHATSAAGFQSNDSGQAIQTQDNQLLMQNCASFIKSVSN